MTRSHCSALIRMARPSWRSPALLTSTRTGPKRSRTASKAASTDAGSPTSACTSPLERPSVAPVKPSSASCAATPRPMPREPPVTSATGLSGRDIDALLPRHDAGAPHEAGAERRERDRVAGLQATLALGLVQRQRDRSARRVRDEVDVDEALLRGHAEAPRGR